MIQISLTGNLTADAITRDVNGKTVIAFTIAHNDRYKTKNGEIKDTVTYVRCAMWNNPDLAKLLYKGRSIYASGILKVNNWYDGDGIKQTSVDMRVSYFKVFGKGKKAAEQTELITAASNENEAVFVADAISADEAAQAVKDLPF